MRTKGLIADWKAESGLGVGVRGLLENASLNAARESVGASVEELKRLILAKLAEQIVPAHSNSHNWTIPARDPRICRGYRADKGRDGQRDRERGVAIIPAACGNSRNRRVPRTGRKTAASALAENLSWPLPRGSSLFSVPFVDNSHRHTSHTTDDFRL
jgi:hypothetical protein